LRPAPIGAPPGGRPLRLWSAAPVLGDFTLGQDEFRRPHCDRPTSSLRFIEVNWNLGFIDGTTLPPGQPLGSFSFDQFAGSILNMFDFDDKPNTRPLILKPYTGATGKY